MTYERLKGGDGRMRGLLADWDKWLINADQLYYRFLDRVGESPFLYHEVASVGFLASAAAMAGFTPADLNDKAMTTTRGPGRWSRRFLFTRRTSYSFEFNAHMSPHNKKPVEFSSERHRNSLTREEFLTRCGYRRGGPKTRDNYHERHIAKVTRLPDWPELMTGFSFFSSTENSLRPPQLLQPFCRCWVWCDYIPALSNSAYDHVVSDVSEEVLA